MFGPPELMLYHFFDEINKDRRTKDITEMESEGWRWDVGKYSRLKHPLHLMVNARNVIIYTHTCTCTHTHTHTLDVYTFAHMMYTHTYSYILGEL